MVRPRRTLCCGHPSRDSDTCLGNRDEDLSQIMPSEHGIWLQCKSRLGWCQPRDVVTRHGVVAFMEGLVGISDPLAQFSPTHAATACDRQHSCRQLQWKRRDRCEGLTVLSLWRVPSGSQLLAHLSFYEQWWKYSADVISITSCACLHTHTQTQAHSLIQHDFLCKQQHISSGVSRATLLLQWKSLPLAMSWSILSPHQFFVDLTLFTHKDSKSS